MKNIFVIFLSAYLSIIIQFADGQYNRLDVTVYCESLCPDSVRFIQSQLAPHYDDLKDFINIQFVPFGKSKSFRGGEHFECQHGAQECYINKVQSCVLHHLEDQPTQVEYMKCQMKFDNNLVSGQVCAQKVGLQWETVEKCFATNMGTQLQLLAEKQQTETLNNIKFVPTIVYDGEFDQKLQDRSQYDFKNVVCELIDDAAPACQ